MIHSVAVDAPIDLNLLPLFLLVSEVGNFSDAAKKMGLRRSSVSRSVASLERSLGVQLFHRTTRQVNLTTAGKALHAKVAHQLGDLLDSLGTVPEREEEPSGDLRITAPDDIGSVVLPEIVTGFTLRYPKVNVDVHASNRVVDLVGEQFDLALRISLGKRADSSLISKKICDIPIHLFASPTYLARAGAPRKLADTTTHAWVWFKHVNLPSPIPPPKGVQHISAENMMFLLNAVRAGAGIAPLPAFLAREDIAAGRLVRVLPRFSIPQGTLYFVHPPLAHVPLKVAAFRDYLLEHLASHPIA